MWKKLTLGTTNRLTHLANGAQKIGCHEAGQRGYSQVLLHAPSSAVSISLRQGFKASNVPYDASRICCVELTNVLRVEKKRSYGEKVEVFICLPKKYKATNLAAFILM